EVVARHAMPISIISDCDGRFILRFWQMFQRALGTRLDMSMTYHPHIDGHSDRTLVLWAAFDESQMIEPEIVEETTDKIFQIKDRLKAARDRQKSYANNRRKPLEFCVGNHVLLKVSP
nr:reverse transcriptase domain-containing protein [Tanacetum cinerariifolium]